MAKVERFEQQAKKYKLWQAQVTASEATTAKTVCPRLRFTQLLGYDVMSDYHKELGKAVESAAERLPEGYTINIVLERNSGDAVLYDDEGEECEFPSNRESLADTINDAVEFATRELLNRLQNLATHEEPGHYGGEITAVRDILKQLEVEEQYA